MKRLAAAAFAIAALSAAAPLSAEPAYACQPPHCWGAIAWNPSTRAWWVVTDVATPEEAEDRALARCRNCKELQVFRNACFAVFWAPGGGFGASQAASERLARERARDACYQYNAGKRCRPLTSACTLRSYVNY